MSRWILQVSRSDERLIEGRVASYPAVNKGAFRLTTLSLPNICSMNPHSMQVAEITQRHVDRSAEICSARITREYVQYSTSKSWPPTTMRSESSFKVRLLDHRLLPFGFSVLDMREPLAYPLSCCLIVWMVGLFFLRWTWVFEYSIIILRWGVRHTWREWRANDQLARHDLYPLIL